MTQEEFDREELSTLERTLARAESPPHPVDGQEAKCDRYRRSLARDVAELRDRVEAREAYDVDDPHHPDFHDTHADLWDNREKVA